MHVYISIYICQMLFSVVTHTIGIQAKEGNMSAKKLKGFAISPITLAISIQIVVSCFVFQSCMHIVDLLYGTIELSNCSLSHTGMCISIPKHRM